MSVILLVPVKLVNYEDNDTGDIGAGDKEHIGTGDAGDPGTCERGGTGTGDAGGIDTGKAGGDDDNDTGDTGANYAVVVMLRGARDSVDRDRSYFFPIPIRTVMLVRRL